MYTEVHNVGYGECIVFCYNDGILMVDCGSSNLKVPCGLNFTDYVQTYILPRYAAAGHRTFLLTHCHRDHSCGFWRILKKYPKYFDRIILPAVPCDESGRPLLLEFAFYVYAFLNRFTGYSKSNTDILKIFSRAAHAAGPECVFSVRQGDQFGIGGMTYDIIWPAETAFPYSEEFAAAVDVLNGLLMQPLLPDYARKFLQLKQDFCLTYITCQSFSPLCVEYIDELDEILRETAEIVPNLLLLPCAEDIIDVLAKNQNIYSSTLNSACIVFQNRRMNGKCTDNDVLMTGDAPPFVLESVKNLLYDGYYTVKAPHHGTESGYSDVLSLIEPSHIIISNGPYDGGGKISAEYSNLQSVKHCTNYSICDFYIKNHYCCKDFSICSEISKIPQLTIKCPFCHTDATNAPCGISILSGTDY